MNRALQCATDPQQGGERDIYDSCFDLLNIAWIHTGEFGQPFLGQTSCHSFPADSRSEVLQLLPFFAA